VTDEKPPRLDSSERETLLALRADAIVAAAPTLDAPCRRLDVDAPVNLRWVLMHLLEETARHAGHADVLRELLDGVTGR
jgi:hypothetical protein